MTAESASSLLTPWSNFYIMLGSSAAALTGLTFIVITLASGQERGRSNEGIAAFTTPTVVHFCAALLASAVGVAPWHTLLGPALVLGAAGLYGVVHVLGVTVRMRRVSGYEPDLEDWISYVALPFVAYGVILAGAIAVPFVPRSGLFTIAAGVVLLIFIGVRNAWDVVTFLVVADADDATDSSKPGESADGTR